jgi:hypothetical protein
MTNHISLTADAEANVRWREWQARGAEADRRTATTMGALTVLVFVGLAFWIFVQLV